MIKIYKYVHKLNTLRYIVQYMNNKNESDNLNVLRVIKNKPKITQREMANNLGLSLGKLNYVLKSLKNKGHIKINNFKNNKNKMNYLYLLTPRGIEEKISLTANFLKRKIVEHEKITQEIEQLKKDAVNQ